jgi:hypothetical protein
MIVARENLTPATTLAALLALSGLMSGIPAIGGRIVLAAERGYRLRGK